MGRHRIAVAAVLLHPIPLPRTYAGAMTRIVLVGSLLWLLALVATLVVPGWHTGDRSWWPWTCVAGLTLGLLGWAYLRRGRGNADQA